MTARQLKHRGDVITLMDDEKLRQYIVSYYGITYQEIHGLLVECQIQRDALRRVADAGCQAWLHIDLLESCSRENKCPSCVAKCALGELP